MCAETRSGTLQEGGHRQVLPRAKSPAVHVEACPDCDLVVRWPEAGVGPVRCPRCGHRLGWAGPQDLEAPLALTVTGLLLFTVANAFPFLSLDIQGQRQESVLLSGALSLLTGDQPVVGLVVMMTTFVVPLMDLSGTLYLLLRLRQGKASVRLARLYRLLRSARPWGMLEVFLLGVLVSVVKLGELATLIPGPAAAAFGLLVLVMAALYAALGPSTVWSRLGDEG